MKKYISKHKSKPSSISNNKHKQGAISLSMNLLVILIISLVILGMGVTLLYKMVGTALIDKEKLDARTQQELLRLLVDEGKKVALPLHIADLYGNEKHVFGIGILNVESENNLFQLSIELDGAFDLEGNKITSEFSPSEWLLYYQDNIKIEQSSHHIEPILVTVPGNAQKGKYLFNVKILKGSDGSQYGNTQKFIVNVH